MFLNIRVFTCETMSYSLEIYLHLPSNSMCNDWWLLRTAAQKVCRKFGKKSSSVQGFYRYNVTYIVFLAIGGYNAGF